MRVFRTVVGMLVLVFLSLVSSAGVVFEGTPGRHLPPAASGIQLVDLGTPPGKVGGGLLWLMFARGYQPIKPGSDLARVLSFMDSRGGAKAEIWFDHILTGDEVAFLEKSFGLRYLRVNGKVSNLTPIYSVTVPWEQIIPVARLPYVKIIDTSMWPAPISPMDSSVPGTGANLIWPLRDNPGRNVTGKGVKIAVYDASIDIFHPDLFQPDPDELPHDWLDEPGSPNHVFDPGRDYVDLNRNGQPDANERLNFIDAYANGQFDARLDWLYADEDGSGKREFGTWALDANGSPRFGEGTPSYGERLFIVAKTNHNETLDWGEKLIALSISKIYKTWSLENGQTVERERSSANSPLIGTPRTPPNGVQDHHGTLNAGIAVGGDWRSSPNFSLRKYVGMAPEPVVRNQQGAMDGGLLIISSHAGNFGDFQTWAPNNGADIMLYEGMETTGHFFDGSEPIEGNITALASLPGAASIVQVVPAGNLAVNPDTGNTGKHFQMGLQANQPQEVHFSVPAQAGYRVAQTIIWRDLVNPLTYRLTAPGGAYLDLPPAAPGVFQHGDLGVHRVSWVRLHSGRGTARTDIEIRYNDGHMAQGQWTLQVTSPAGATVNGYLKDEKTAWWGGVEYIDRLSSSKTVVFPATADKAMVVASYKDQNGAIASYSGRGPRIDDAPVIDIAAPGDNLTGPAAGTGDVHGQYMTLSTGGTSHAAPHVAGAAALMLQANPGLKHDDIEARFKETAARDAFTGAAPDPNIWGSGKLNAYAAFNNVRLVPGAEPLPWAAAWVTPNYYSVANVPGGIRSYRLKLALRPRGLRCWPWRGWLPSCIPSGGLKIVVRIIAPWL